jgi:opacity protein-like surface antigen
MKKLLFGALLVTLIAATPARAQDDKKVHINIGGGVTMPVSTIKDEFSTGGGFNLGVSFDPSPVAGFQVEYGYNGLSGKDRQITVFPAPTAAVGTTGLIQSHHAMHFIDFNGTVQPGGESRVKPYGIGGFGMYYRTISLTTPDVGFATVCDPYWYVCFPTAVSIDRIIGERNSWDPGVDFGGGVRFGIGESAQFYVEGRWHYMWGPEVTDAAGTKRNANAQYFPITFGFRF